MQFTSHSRVLAGLRLFGRVSAIALVVGAGLALPGLIGADGGAWAESHGQQSGSGSQGANKGGSGGHEDGTHEDETHDEGHDDTGKGPQYGGGSGEADEGGEGRGPQYGGGSGASGGKPVWAQEGIPEVELGRLNVARSPTSVLDRAYAEALSSFTAEMVGFYNMSISEAVTALSLDFEAQTYIDSPLQNLALLRDALDGSSVLNTLPQIENDTGTLMAIFLGTASDKTIEVTDRTAYAVARILGTELTQAQAAALAANAEAIRIAILAGHG